MNGAVAFAGGLRQQPAEAEARYAGIGSRFRASTVQAVVMADETPKGDEGDPTVVQNSEQSHDGGSWTDTCVGSRGSMSKHPSPTAVSVDTVPAGKTPLVGSDEGRPTCGACPSSLRDVAIRGGVRQV